MAMLAMYDSPSFILPRVSLGMGQTENYLGSKGFMVRHPSGPVLPFFYWDERGEVPGRSKKIPRPLGTNLHTMSWVL